MTMELGTSAAVGTGRSCIVIVDKRTMTVSEKRGRCFAVVVS